MEKTDKVIRIQYYQSPCGELILGSFGDKLCLCDWVNEERRKTIDGRIQKMLQARYETGISETIATAITQLDEYFAQKRTAFDVPLLLLGTDFQKAVWNELLKVPYGMTKSYAGLSSQLGNPKAVRAVAAANGANAISIFIPCHRIIGSNQKLTGYAGGLSAKKILLELESYDFKTGTSL
ncbi:methylated-DNA--[protein]-cysteine S-methyltransferase [Bacteroides sp. GD17]|jgi:methylated-DNA-[protein]-cysteine S-methyltransferase|uniref:methylated-DNA--[protein]-cysteine S-methyltransferase n=1 Tax=Bacteroides sp. GD17 TaxID=3139826 RepID=UPI0025F48920|nr:methylated-DNA--[protein]-cysteine S-methyltransferase [uncultured Bacteroides sp.]